MNLRMPQQTHYANKCERQQFADAAARQSTRERRACRPWMKGNGSGSHTHGFNAAIKISLIKRQLSDSDTQMQTAIHRVGGWHSYTNTAKASRERAGERLLQNGSGGRMNSMRRLAYQLGSCGGRSRLARCLALCLAVWVQPSKRRLLLKGEYHPRFYAPRRLSAALANNNHSWALVLCGGQKKFCVRQMGKHLARSWAH